MAMSEDVQREYDNVLAQVIIEHGAIVALHNTWFGWCDYKATQHAQHCGIASYETPREDMWHEFMGTFYEGDTSQHGMCVNVTCKCGKITNRTMRWHANMQTIAEEVFAAAQAKWRRNQYYIVQ